VLGSACLGLRVRALWPFLVLAVLAFVLALGPYRSWAGETIRMPYWFWMQLPGMNAGRYPAANLRIFHLAVAVLAAAGLATRGRGARILAGSLLALVLGAWLLRPCSVEPLEVEPVHREIAAATEPGAVLELPADLEATLRKMALGQIVHQRPLMSGPLTRVAPEAWKFFREVPVVRRFLRPPAGGIPQVPEEPEENVRILREWGVAFVVVRRTLATINASAYADLAAYLSLHPGLSVAVSPEGHLLARVAPAP
jgi:hypothetical protein